MDYPREQGVNLTGARAPAATPISVEFSRPDRGERAVVCRELAGSELSLLDHAPRAGH